MRGRQRGGGSIGRKWAEKGIRMEEQKKEEREAHREKGGKRE